MSNQPEQKTKRARKSKKSEEAVANPNVETPQLDQPTSVVDPAQQTPQLDQPTSVVDPAQQTPQAKAPRKKKLFPPQQTSGDTEKKCKKVSKKQSEEPSSDVNTSNDVDVETPKKQRNHKRPKDLVSEVKSSLESEVDSAETPKKKRAKKSDSQKKEKRRATCFIVFSSMNRNKVKDENPNFKVTEVAEKLGEQWRSMSDVEKQVYKDLAAADEKFVARVSSNVPVEAS